VVPALAEFAIDERKLPPAAAEVFLIEGVPDGRVLVLCRGRCGFAIRPTSARDSRRKVLLLTPATGGDCAAG
jgi:hypothetical protein